MWAAPLDVALEADSVSNMVFDESRGLVYLTTVTGTLFAIEPAKGVLRPQGASWQGAGGVPLLMGAGPGLVMAFNFSDFSLGFTQLAAR